MSRDLEPAFAAKLSNLFFSGRHWVKQKLLHALRMPHDDFYRFSYSQLGEDMVLTRLLNGRSPGFYVDIGAHHPQRFSNTYYFYLLGWRGINVDATPGSMSQFDRMRSRDINLEYAVSDKKERLVYYCFEEPALNGFFEASASERQGFGKSAIVSKTEIETVTLAEILEKHMPDATKIDLLTIDVEGLDFQVLVSNDWTKFRPKVVVIEDLQRDISDIAQSPVYKFLVDLDYSLDSVVCHNLIFKSNTLS